MPMLNEEKAVTDTLLLADLAEQWMKDHPDAIPPLAAKVNNIVSDLNEIVPDSSAPESTIQFLDYTTQPGFLAYQRTALLMFFKAMEDVLPGSAAGLAVDFALGDGVYIHLPADITATSELAEKIQSRMHHIQETGYPIKKRVVPVLEARKIFEGYGMKEKAQAMLYMPENCSIPIYSIGHFDGHFYGPLLTSTSLVNVFELRPYGDGLLLRTPKRKEPGVLHPFSDQTFSKVYGALDESVHWRQALDIQSVSSLNDAIVNGRANELILISEALQEKKIAEIAQKIAEQPQTKVILIAGPSSSGKTSFANRLKIQLQVAGLNSHLISTDNYFVDREHTPRHPDGSYNFDTIDAIDLAGFTRDMNKLLAGENVSMPVFNFIKGVQEYPGNFLQIGDSDVLIVEGLFSLQDKLSAGIPDEAKFRIYISALGQINLDEMNYFKSTDGRLIRRLIRDNRTRGTNARQTIASWPSVRKGEEENIFPFQNNADVIFNSSTLYELAVFRKYVQPLLYQIPSDAPEYPEARRLLSLIEPFLGIENDLIPRNSLIREFAGGSCFNV